MRKALASLLLVLALAHPALGAGEVVDQQYATTASPERTSAHASPAARRARAWGCQGVGASPAGSWTSTSSPGGSGANARGTGSSRHRSYRLRVAMRIMPGAGANA